VEIQATDLKVVMNSQVVKRTPLHELARAMDGSFRQVGGWEVVDAFAGEGDVRDATVPQCALVDRSARAKVIVEGASVAAVIGRAWQIAALDVNHGAPVPRGFVYRLRHDQVFFSGEPATEPAFTAAVEAAAQPDDGLLTITAATHGRSELWLMDPAARELLSRLCGLDLHPDYFPQQTARQTSVAKTKQLVIHTTVAQCPVYALIGARSLGAYLWQTIVQAAHDLDLQFHGEAFMEALAHPKERDAGS